MTFENILISQNKKKYFNKIMSSSRKVSYTKTSVTAKDRNTEKKLTNPKQKLTSSLKDTKQESPTKNPLLNSKTRRKIF